MIALPAFQLSLLIRDPLMKVLAFKFREAGREQTRVALNISPVAPYLGGKEVSHHRHPRRSQNCSFDGKGVPTAPKIVGRKFKFNMGVPSPRGSARY